jgi:hypothetical protein
VAAVLAGLVILLLLVGLAAGLGSVVSSGPPPATTTSTTVPGGTTTTTRPPIRPGAAGAVIEPARLSFQAQALKRPTATQQVMVRNTGRAPLTITGIRLAGANPSDFQFDDRACLAGEVPAGGSCPIPVRFIASAAGTRTATLLVGQRGPGSLASASLTGQTPPEPPDLTPGNLSYDGSLQVLTVTVRNTGPGDAGPSTTAVSFSGGESRSLATSTLPAGGSTDLQVTVPSTCTGDCGWTVVVDAGRQVAESNEDNNTASDHIVG